MNFQNIISHIASEDPEFYERTSDRRLAIRTFVKGAALTAVPFALGGLLKKAYGQSVSSDIIEVLNFALTLEFLEAEYYNKALLNAGGIGITGAALGAIQTISKHEDSHVTTLKDTIVASGGTPISKPAIDLTGGLGSPGGAGTGPFKAALVDNYDLFLALAQTFEDTGVRAYKGQAANIMSNNAILTAALQIHSVEARHAAHIRTMRSARTALVDGTVKPWITLNKSGIAGGALNAAINMSYVREENVLQGGIDITSLGFSAEAASESFDEPLTAAEVVLIVKPFVAM